MRTRVGSMMKLTQVTMWLVVGLWLLTMTGSTLAMIYKPHSGSIWDPSILYHDGKYYMFSMYSAPGGAAHNVWSAVSNDGVHWKDVGIVITFHDREDNGIWKPFIAKAGDRFILNHGALSKKNLQNRCVFWESKDLRHWTMLYESAPDPRWYMDTIGTRWDAMYTLPKEEGNPNAGYWGYITAIVKEELSPNAGYWGYITAIVKGELSSKGYLEGMLESKDGVHWEAIAPPIFDFGKFQWNFFDVGGVERLGDKYYFIGCSGPYNGNWNATMHTFVSDSPTGPFVADEEAFRLSGTSGLPGWPHVQSLAAWARDKDGTRLISNYGPALDGEVWMQPLKRAVVDKNQHLRLAYWTPNDAVKGSSLSLAIVRCKPVFPANAEVALRSENKQPAPGAICRVILSEGGAVLQPAKRDPDQDREDRPMLALLAPHFDLENGIVLEGAIRIDAASNARPCSGGFYIEEEPGMGTAIMMEVGHPTWRHTRISRLTIGDKISFDVVDETGPGCATVTGLENGKKHSFRLWIRKNMFELYVDDMYVQTFLTRAMTGAIGFFSQNGTAAFGDLKAWQMNLDDVE